MLRSGWMSAKISWGLQISKDSQRDAVSLLCDCLMVSRLTQQVGGQIHGFSSAQDSGPRTQEISFLTSQEDYRFNREKMDP